MALGAKQAYLFVYNAVLAAGWSLVFIISLHAFATKGYNAVYGSVANLTKLLIYVSIAETYHAAFLVRSGVMSNILQWVARAHALLLVVDPEPSVHQSMGAAAMILAWSFGESTRYPSYALSQLGNCPYVFTWLRYTAFILVYPAGLVSELVSMWNVIPLVENSRRLCVGMPNAANIVFDYSWFLRILLVAQPVLWWPMYSSLWAQRRKKLAPKDKGV